MEEKDIIRINGTVDSTVYSKGDTCLLINPFDTYHLFRVYNNWNSDNRTLLDLADNGQKLFLVFKSKNTEIRIEEYVNSGSKYKTDKTNGEVLFKITKENATKILSMSSNTFYITRVFEKFDNKGNTVYTSGEEVLFTGNWADENKWSGACLTAAVESLKKQLEAANAQILELTRLVNEYKLKIDSLTDENSSLRERVDSLESENEDLRAEIENMNAGNEFTSVVISDNATYQYYNGDTEVDGNGNTLVKQIEEKKEEYKDTPSVVGNKLQLTEKQLGDIVKNSNLNTVISNKINSNRSIKKINSGNSIKKV